MQFDRDRSGSFKSVRWDRYPRTLPKFGPETLTAMYSILNRESGVRVATGPPGLTGGRKVMRTAVKLTVFCAGSSPALSASFPARCKVHRRLYIPIRARSAHGPGSIPGAGTISARLSSGDGASPTQRISRVRSPGGLPFSGRYHQWRWIRLLSETRWVRTPPGPPRCWQSTGKD